MSDVNHGAAAAAVDAMDRLTTDPEPDTESHLSLSDSRPASPDDSVAADLLLLHMREALRKYVDVRVAAADGFEELPATEGKHTIHHLSNWGWARAEGREFNPARPTSLLYREGADGMLALVGAMYSAPASSSMKDLNDRIPTSLARWHWHINWCAPKSTGGSQWLTVRDGAPQFGPRSPITSREACEAAGGISLSGRVRLDGARHVHRLRRSPHSVERNIAASGPRGVEGSRYRSPTARPGGRYGSRSRRANHTRRGSSRSGVPTARPPGAAASPDDRRDRARNGGTRPSASAGRGSSRDSVGPADRGPVAGKWNCDAFGWTSRRPPCSRRASASPRRI